MQFYLGGNCKPSCSSDLPNGVDDTDLSLTHGLLQQEKYRAKQAAPLRRIPMTNNKLIYNTYTIILNTYDLKRVWSYQLFFSKHERIRKLNKYM